MGELTELVLKSARSQSKLGLRLEELERKVEGGFSLLQKPVAADRAEQRYDEVLDALDLLDEAVRSSSSEGLRTGLQSISQRLSRFLARVDITRSSPSEGAPVDGSLFRVSGTQESEAVPDGTIIRVVRAAAVQHQKLIREGEVIVARRPA